MWLTKNEKKVLKLLVDNAKLSDTSIAHKLNISSQAIGKIRKKLEEEIIKKYTVELDLEKLGLNLFIIGKASITNEGNGEVEKVEQRLKAVPQNIGIFKLFRGNHEYIFISLYRDLNDLKDFLDNEHKTQKIAQFIKIDEIHEIPVKNTLKHSCTGVLNDAIDKLGTKKNKLFSHEESIKWQTKL